MPKPFCRPLPPSNRKLPFLLNLTADERLALPKPGDKSQAFIRKALEVAAQNPDIRNQVREQETGRCDLSISGPIAGVNRPGAWQCFCRRMELLLAGIRSSHPPTGISPDADAKMALFIVALPPPVKCSVIHIARHPLWAAKRLIRKD